MPKQSPKLEKHHPKHFAHGTGPGTHLEGPRHPGREFAGVCEARPGIIESTHIAPLDDMLSTESPRSTPGLRTPRDDK